MAYGVGTFSSLSGCLDVLACAEPVHAVCQYFSLMNGKLRVFWLQRHVKNDRSILILNTFIFINLLVSFYMLGWVSVPPCHHPQSWPPRPADGVAGMGPCIQLLEVVTQDTSGLSAVPPGLGSCLPTRGHSSGDPAAAPLEPAGHALDQILTGPLHADTVVCLGGAVFMLLAFFIFISVICFQ